MVHTDRFGFESPGEKQAGLGEDTSPEVLRLTTQSRPGLQAGGGSWIQQSEGRKLPGPAGTPPAFWEQGCWCQIPPKSLRSERGGL